MNNSQIYPIDLTDSQWHHIKEWIPRAKSGGRPREEETYNVLRVSDVVHIPVAGFADLLSDLSDPDKPDWSAPMPTPERFCVGMGALDVGDDSSVVLYDGS